MLLPLAFVSVIKNVAFSYGSSGVATTVKSTEPPFGVLVNCLPSMVPVKLPSSEPSVTRDTVML